MKRRRAQLAMVKPAAAVVLVLLLIIGVSWASCRKKKAAEAPAVQLTTDVIISEIMTNNTGIVSDGAGNLPPDGYILVWCTGEKVENALIADFKLGAGDVIRLTNAAGEPLFTMEIPSIYTGYTLSWDDNARQYVEMLPSPLYPNTPAGSAAYEESRKLGENDAPLSVGATAQHNGVYISELMARNGTTTAGPNGQYPDWIELLNTTNAPVDLSGCGISDDIRIDPGQYLVLWCMVEQMDGYISLPFNLSGSKGDAVILVDKNGGILDMWEFGAQEKDYSLIRGYTGDGNLDVHSDFVVTDKPTPGYPNTAAGYAAFDKQRNPDVGVHDITFSEILSDGYRYKLDAKGVPDDDDQGKWVELYNRSDQSVDLSGYSLSDNEKKPTKWVFPEGTSIAGKGYLILYMSGSLPLEGKDEKSVTAEMKARTLNFAVSGQGETLYLYNDAGTLIDRVTVPMSVWPACPTPRWGTPGASATRPPRVRPTRRRSWAAPTAKRPWSPRPAASITAPRSSAWRSRPGPM